MKEIKLKIGEKISFDRCGVNAGSMSFDLKGGTLVMTHNRALLIPGLGIAYKPTIHDTENNNCKWLVVNA